MMVIQKTKEERNIEMYHLGESMRRHGEASIKPLSDYCKIEKGEMK